MIVPTLKNYLKISVPPAHWLKVPERHNRFEDSLLFIMHPTLGIAQLDHRQHKDNGKEHPGNGRGKAHLKITKAVEIDQIDQRHGGITGATARHHVRFGKKLKCADKADDQQEKGGR